MNFDKEQSLKKHIVGIGGIFFKAKDPEGLTKWYEEKLGFSVQVPFYEDDTAISFRWKTFANENQATIWAPFSEDSTDFEPSKKEWMINYIVKEIEELLEKLQKKGINQLGEIKKQPYGKFAWILDPEGNKIEFWEPDTTFFKGKFDEK